MSATTPRPAPPAGRSAPRAARPGRFTTTYGPWAVVTGASSGIGRAVAEQLAAAGAGVVLVARRREALESLADELVARHDAPVRVVVADLAVEDAVREVQEAAADLDVGLLVAAAGFGSSGPFLEADPAVEAEVLAVNAGALVLLTHHFARRFADRGRGGVVLLSSLVAYQGTPWAASYAATKAYVQVLAEGLHAELAPRGVDVLASAPGPVHSGFAERAGMTMGRALRPEQVARATLAALGRRTTVAPGALSKVLTWSLAPLPRSARTRIMGGVMRGMAAPDATAGPQR